MELALAGALLRRRGHLATEQLPHEGRRDADGGRADHERSGGQEGVERLDPEGPGGDPEDEAHGQGHEDAHLRPPLRSATARRTRVAVLKAFFIAFSAPESCGGSMPTWRVKAIPSK